MISGKTGIENPSCPVCRGALALSPARGRKSGKPFLMLLRPEDARHFRAFINDQDFVGRVTQELLGRRAANPGLETYKAEPTPADSTQTGPPVSTGP